MPCSSRLWWLVGVLVSACVDGSADDDSTSSPSRTDDDDDDGASTDDPSVGETSSVTTTATTTLETSAGETDGSDTSNTDSATASADTSSSEATTGDEPNAACVAGCMVEFGCQDTCECATTWRSEQACVQWCDANLDEAELFTEFCRDAWEAMSECLGTLSCEAYQEFHHPSVPDYPCVSEAETLAFECDGQ